VKAAVAAVPCSSCGSPAGLACQTLTGGPTALHAARRDAAIASGVAGVDPPKRQEEWHLLQRLRGQATDFQAKAASLETLNRSLADEGPLTPALRNKFATALADLHAGLARSVYAAKDIRDHLQVEISPENGQSVNARTEELAHWYEEEISTTVPRHVLRKLIKNFVRDQACYEDKDLQEALRNVAISGYNLSHGSLKYALNKRMEI
jgi:hypothetical protein